MLILLPPSETKTAGGDGAALNLDALSFPQLTDTRRELVHALSTLAIHDVATSLRVLGISERQVEQVQQNAELWQAPTLPALERYTGVLYDALDIRSVPDVQRERADARLAVASALFGLVHGSDPIPAYRLSADTKLPEIGSLREMWRPALEPVLADVDDLVVDLRSGAYASLARVPNAVHVRVLSEDENGQRKVVSHHNKAHKGKLARALATTPSEPSTMEDVLDVAAGAGMRIERESAQRFAIIVSK